MNNPPAFPSLHWVAPQGHSANENPQGMTLRDYFAAKAMQAQISMPETLLAIAQKTITSDQICGSCYEWADEMLKARQA